MVIDLQHSQIVMALIVGAGPYLTQIVHYLVEQGQSKMPDILKPISPIFIGAMVSSIAKYTGVELPFNLSNISENDITQILTSGYILGGLGAHLNDVVDGFKKTHGPETKIGQFLVKFAGPHTESQLQRLQISSPVSYKPALVQTVIKPPVKIQSDASLQPSTRILPVPVKIKPNSPTMSLKIMDPK